MGVMSRKLVATSAMALLMGAGWSRPADGEEMELRLSYGAYTSGLKALSVAADIDLSGGRYETRITAETTGLVAWFVDWHLEAESAGLVDGDKMRPEIHKAANERRDKQRWVEVTYGVDGPVAVRSQPPTSDEDRPAVTEDLLAGTIDPVSALMNALAGTVRGEQCPAPMAVFDGRRRYDLVGKVLPDRTFRGSGRAPFVGTAVGCEIELTRLAGFKKSEEANRDVLTSTIRVWLADVAGDGVAVPVRLELRGPRGLILVHLQGVQGAQGEIPISAS